jgi:hypothetical protein
MVVELYAVTKDVEWLKEKYASLKQEYVFWQEQRMTPSGLNRFYGQITNREVLKEFGQSLCVRFAMEAPEDDAVLEEYGKAEQMPRLEGKRMIMMLAPNKKK